MRLTWALIVLPIMAVPQAVCAQLGMLPPVSTWREYRENDDGFVVRVPNAVKAREWRDDGRSAGYYVTGNPQQSFSVVAIRWPAGLRAGQAAPAIVEATTKRILANMKAEKVERDEPQNCGEGVPGRILQARLPDELVYAGRVCVTSGNVYRVEAFVEAGQWDEADGNVKAFLESFKPLRR
ncbi:MAG TPA: hypothetical protein VJR58_04840 [Vineibacter sp.]|nr:hypothetical protein [Vineibacter sp.]